MRIIVIGGLVLAFMSSPFVARPTASSGQRAARRFTQQATSGAAGAEARGPLLWDARVDASIRFVRVWDKSVYVGELTGVRELDATTGETRDTFASGGEDISQYE